jgi:dihydroflavonol-4-reductase
MNAMYLVTGVAGHLGNAIVRQLLEQGEKVRGLVLPREQTEGKSLDGVELFAGDITHRESLRPFFTTSDSAPVVVIHCAGIVSIASKAQKKVHDTNVGGTQNIIALCKEYQVQKLVYVSSVHAIPELPHGETISEVERFHPDLVTGPYAKTKAEATALALEATSDGLDVSVVHPSGIVGPYDYGRGHTTQLILDYCSGRLRVGIKGGYDFVDVRDVASGTIAASRLGRPGGCYILSNRFVPIPEFMDLLHGITRQSKTSCYLPLWVAKLTAPVSELYCALLKQPSLYTAYSLYTLSSNARFTHEKASRELAYKVRSFQETVEDTVAWLKSQGRILTLAK